jgi:hypothetical protein
VKKELSMSRFFQLAAFAPVPAVAALVGIVFLAPAPASAQTPSTKLLAKEGAKDGAKEGKSWTPSRTPDGKPDLQGVYTNASVIPLERPKDLGTKEFFTKAEADAYAAKVLSQREVVAPGTYGDVHYNMAQFGLEKGQSKVPTTIRTSLITGPEGRVPPLLPAAQARVAARQAANKGHEFDSAENRTLGEQCIIWPNEGPPMLPEGYNSNLQIVQGEGYVAIMQEMIHDVRIIPTDGRPHLPPDVHQLMGDSRGHWEGNTLVVDTTNFTGRTAFRGSSENLHVVERFTRTDADTVLYQFTVSDPSTWEKSWSGEVLMSKIDGPIFEYACSEGNYGMRNNLSGARADEAKAAQK